jgi:hypothetical protein
VQAPNWSRRRILIAAAGGDTTALHGPLQRLLEVEAEVLEPFTETSSAESRAG